MKTALWAAAAAIALLWPAALAGPLDGAPLDAPLEAIGIGVLIPWLLISNPVLLRVRAIRLAVIALLAWKAVSGAVLVRDGWCLQFVSPVPLYLDDVRTPHSWDVRADWRADPPRCSAIMTTNYHVLERFPAWFYNLPPANNRDAARPGDRPPGATLQFNLTGFLRAPADGLLQIIAGEDVQLSATIDGQAVTHDGLRNGFAVTAGDHDVRIHGDLRRSHWSLDLRFNGSPLWTSAVATLAPPLAIDAWVRPLARFIPAAIVFAIAAIGSIAALRMAGPAVTLAAAAAALLLALVALTGRDDLIRLLPLALLITAAIGATRRARGRLAHALLIGLPWLAIFMAIGWSRAGIFTWYSPGDDWTTYQRFAYRIYLQGYWLQGGEPTLYYQPLYRWIAGALHLVFGDSSVGELFWDVAAILTGATFAFHFVKAVAGRRWAYFASALTLSLYTISPGWYFVGRGLAELTSSGFLYGAAMFALRGRTGSRPAIVMAGLLATLAFVTRLNNLPMALAVCAFALPSRLPAAAIWSPMAAWRRAAQPVVISVLGCVAVGLHLYTLRAWYYSGTYSMFVGSSTNINTMWKLGESLWQSVLSSVLMMLTMNDPPRFDVRALPLLAGTAVSVSACLRVWRFGGLPLSAVVFCLAGVSSALVVRGIGYPGRFSLHLIPIAVVVCVCAAMQLAGRPRSRASL